MTLKTTGSGVGYYSGWSDGSCHIMVVKTHICSSEDIQGFNSTVIQVYAPASNPEETEVERFYEDLQDLLELTAPKMSFSL